MSTINTTYVYSGVLLAPSSGSTTLALTTSGGVPIRFLERTHIEVWKSTDSFEDVANQTQLTRPADFDISTDGTQIELVTPTASGEEYVVRRVTPLERYVTFTPGENLTSQALNALARAALFRAQETDDSNSGFGVDVDAALVAAEAAQEDVATAVDAANDATDLAATAIGTANAASSTASTALSTANAAQTAANNAETTAVDAETTANAALSAVGDVLPFDTVSNVASIPSNPADGEVIEIVDATGIESFTPLSGVPGGFVGDSGLTVRIQYDGTGATWKWVLYYANDSDDRYLQGSTTVTGGTGITASGTLESLTIALDGATQTSLGLADTAVQPARTITAGTGLTGGGSLAANRTISLDSATQASLALADSAIQSLDYASQAQAEAGTDNTRLMTPLRTQQHLDANPPGVPVVGKSAPYTIADSDNGKIINTTASGVTVPDSLSAGTCVSIFNNSALNLTITEGGTGTLRSAGTTDTGDRTLAGYGFATIQCIATGVSVVAGAGVS